MWSPVKGRWTFLRNDVFLSCGESLFPASGDIPAKQTGYLCPQGERGSNTNFNCAIFFSTQPHSLQPVCSVISISRFHFNNLSKSAQKSSWASGLFVTNSISSHSFLVAYRRVLNFISQRYPKLMGGGATSGKVFCGQLAPPTARSCV